MANNTNRQFVIDINPFNSIGLRTVLEGKMPYEAVEEYITQFVKDVHLNIVDIPFILMALDVIHKSLETHLSDKDKEIYNKLKEHSEVITIIGGLKSNNQEDDDV